MTESNGFRSCDTQLELRIEASVPNVWKAITADIAAWWPKPFYVGEAPKGFVVEPRVGGRVYEDWGNGEGALWATVTSLSDGQHLHWVGDLDPRYGGPARSMTSFTLKPDGENATLLQFRDSAYGQLAAETISELEKGWKELLEGNLKPWLEQGRRPERPNSVA